MSLVLFLVPYPIHFVVLAVGQVPTHWCALWFGVGGVPLTQVVGDRPGGIVRLNKSTTYIKVLTTLVKRGAGGGVNLSKNLVNKKI